MARQNLTREDFLVKETAPDIIARKASKGGPMTSFGLVEQMHYLYIKVVKARGLPGTADPYVELQLGNYRAFARPIEKNPNPEWDQVYAFSKGRIQAVTVEILVKDRANVAGDNDFAIIGKYSFVATECPSRVPPDSPLAPQWYTLLDQASDIIRGELMLSFWYGTQADEAFPHAWHSDAAGVSGDGVSSTRSKVLFSPRLWYMRVHVIQAENLVLRDNNINNNNRREPEFFVRALFGNLNVMSGACSGKHPTWDEELMFVAAEPFCHRLVVRVEEKLSNNKEQFVGMIAVPWEKIEKRTDAARATANWYNLCRVEVVEGVQKEVKLDCRIQLRVSLDGGYHVFDEPVQSTSDFRATEKSLCKPAIGTLELGILNATGLSPMKPNNRVDAFCVVKYGNKWVRLRTVVDSLAPQWNEQYTFDVYDPCTVLSIGVFDDGNLQGRDKPGCDCSMGKVRIRLSTLENEKIYTHSYPLVVMQPSGVKKMGEIELAARFSYSYTNVFNTYRQPLLPKMHYILPLSPHQLVKLRDQAVRVLSSRLDRSEPPLRHEVVHCMLVDTAPVWSIRRGTANFSRIQKLFDDWFAILKWFKQVCRWTNPTVTVLAYVTFVFCVYFPGVAMSVMFFRLALKGANGYRKRPRQIPHIDLELSRVYSVTLDDLDEELDTFPTKKSGDILKRRYERLRAIAGRLQELIGDMANQGERVQALLSWRDQIATLIFVIFSFLAGLVFYFCPFKLIVCLSAAYVLRHPRFRSPYPSVPQNFIRRMPAKSDTMI